MKAISFFFLSLALGNCFVHSFEHMRYVKKHPIIETEVAKKELKHDEKVVETDTVVSVLEAKRREYCSFSEENIGDERGANLGDALSGVIEALTADNGSEERLLSTRNNNDARYAVIGAAIYAFLVEGYELSAELLTHSLETNPVSPYSPLYSGVVFSSPKVSEIAASSLMKGTGEFELDSGGSCYGKDLFLAIHNFKFTKNPINPSVVTISDKYDFEEGGIGDLGLIGFANDVFASFQRDGLINEYDVLIEADSLLLPRIEKVSGSNDENLRFEITNTTREEVSFFYNKKLLNRDSAVKWSGINDAKHFLLAPNETARIDLSKDGQSNTYSISYLKGDERIVISGYAFDKGIQLSVEIRRVKIERCNGVALMGKNGSKWLFSFKNVFDETVTLEFNRYMCFLEDAKTWSNLYHLQSFNVYPEKEIMFEISENFFADYVAIRLRLWTEIITMHANELSANCSMNMRQAVEPIRRFLRLAIRRKYVGSWDIDVTNTYSKHIIVEYNSKMCYDADARSWANLHDVKRINLDSRKTATVMVSENWFATTVAFSYVLDGVRLISYANRLGADGSISVFNAVV